MGIFSGLFRSRDKPQNRTTGSAYSFFFGGSSAGKRVNERSAMQMTAVYSCVRILAEAVAGLPLHLYRYKEDGGKEKAIDHPLYLLLHDEPNPEMSSFVFRETLMTHLLLWGNAYAQIIRNGKGEVIALYPLMPDRMTVDRDSKGQLYYEYTVSMDDAPTVKGSLVRLHPSDVLHIPGLGFDGLVGYTTSPALTAESPSLPTATQKENTALTPAISQTATKAVTGMSEDKFRSEMSYLAALSIAKNLREKGLLSEEEYAVIDTNLRAEFSPSLGTLLSENDLI